MTTPYTFTLTEQQLNELVIPLDCIHLIMEYLYALYLWEWKVCMKHVLMEYRPFRDFDNSSLLFELKPNRVKRFNYRFGHNSYIDVNIKQINNNGRLVVVAPLHFNYKHTRLYNDNGETIVHSRPCIAFNIS